MFVPIRRDPIVFRESFSDASALQKNISQLTGQLQHLTPTTSQIARSAENISEMSSQSGSVTSINSEGATRGKKNQLANFKKSHLSHSTGDLNLNNRLNLSLFGDVQLNDSQFFEVMYIGKIKVSHKKVPTTFIDDAIPKFLAHDKQKMKSLEDAAKQSSSLEHQNLSDTSTLQSELKLNLTRDGDGDQSGSDSSMGDDKKLKDESKQFGRLKEIMRSESIDEGARRNRSASIGCVEQNRTMVFILGRTDIRLISPDRKQILLHKNFEDLVQAVQGVINSEHFGIICSETKEAKTEFIGYVFKCQSGSISHDIMTSVSKSLETLEQTKLEEEEKNHLSELLTCDHCPMIWYNRLVSTIDGLNEKKTYNTIMRFIEDLNDEDHEIITQKFFGSDKVNDFPLREKNKFLIALIEAHCQMRQRRHVHDTMENRSEFLNQYLGGSTIFMKAKKSLTSSFDHLLKRRGSKDFVDTNNNSFTHEDSLKFAPKQTRSMSLAPNAPQTLTLKRFSPERQQVNTSKMDMFLKVGNSPKDNVNKVGSWRQNMLKNVAVENERLRVIDDSIKLLPTKTKKKQRLRKKRTPDELRDLWKFAGKQIVLLLRMEKENARLQERQNEHDIRRMKLDYDEIIPCNQQLTEVWENYISEASKALHTDNRLFLQAIKSGVPRSKRGEVWMMLAAQYDKNHPPLDVSEFPSYHVPYEELLKNLTEHQHAIFMDIGRTFPNHEYYRAPFGLGQLSLFNILKAYSILDPELGYCQGLAFICGVLLLHLNEQETFNLLKHLMLNRQMRLNYLPDMKQFQMQLYQLSRLIKDNIPEVYELLDKNDVATTLYASSWMLTIFSSSFELGFVSKVYDLLLFASNEVIFRVILSLLQVHKDELLKLDCFEDIMNYLKNVIPKIDEPTMSSVFKNVYTLNISRQLMDYKIEYSVLKEEIHNTNQHIENLNQAKEENKSLQRQLQIAESNIERLENIRHTQQQEVQSMQIQMHSLEVTIQTLGNYLTSLSTHRTDVDIPTDIRRLMQQLEYQHSQQRQQQMKRRPVFLERKIGKSVSVNNSMGMSFNLKVLVEQNENDHVTSPTSPSAEEAMIVNSIAPPPELFLKQEMTAEIVKQQPQNPKPNLSTRESPEKIRLIEQAAIEETPEPETLAIGSTHPLSCSDINFQFNTMQLKTIKPANNFRKKT